MGAPTRPRAWFHLGPGDAPPRNGCRAWLRPWPQRSRSITHSHLPRAESDEGQVLNQIISFQKMLTRLIKGLYWTQGE